MPRSRDAAKASPTIRVSGPSGSTVRLLAEITSDRTRSGACSPMPKQSRPPQEMPTKCARSMPSSSSPPRVRDPQRHGVGLRFVRLVAPPVTPVIDVDEPELFGKLVQLSGDGAPRTSLTGPRNPPSITTGAPRRHHPRSTPGWSRACPRERHGPSCCRRTSSSHCADAKTAHAPHSAQPANPIRVGACAVKNAPSRPVSTALPGLIWAGIWPHGPHLGRKMTRNVEHPREGLGNDNAQVEALFAQSRGWGP